MATKHFSDAELLTKGRHPEVDNEPPDWVLNNIYKTQELLEKARAILGIPIYVRYGYRSPDLNKACGGSPTSAHTEGLAADIYFDDVSPDEAAHVLFQHPHFMAYVDQLIIERGCLHVGLPCKASGYQPRYQLRGEAWINGKRTYPLVAVWTPKT